MRGSLWVLLGIGLAGLVALTWMSHSFVTKVGGLEEAQDLQQVLRASNAAVLEPEPPLRAQRIPGSEAWPGFRWRIEAALRPSAKPGSPEAERAVRRMVERALRTTIQGRGPSGVLLVLHHAGAPDEERLFDARGLPAKEAAR